MPATFAPGEQPFDIIAPTPRPPQSPSWLNPNTSLEGTLQGAIASEHVEDDQEWPPLRFGRGERPDAEDEDEPDSEEEFVPRARPLEPTRVEQEQAVPSLSPSASTKRQQAGSLDDVENMQSRDDSHPVVSAAPSSEKHETLVPIPPKADVNDGEIPFGSANPNGGSSGVQSSTFFHDGRQ